MKKSIRNQYILILSILIIFAFLLILVIGNEKKNKFIGKWESKNGTIYEFGEKNRGTVIVPLKKYTFTYTINDNVVTIDFDSKDAIDTDYEYIFKKDKLIITSENGTFTLFKK